MSSGTYIVLYKQTKSNPNISFRSQSFKAVEFSHRVCSDVFVYSNTNELLYINFLHKNYNATWVRIASFWKEDCTYLR